MYLMVHEPYVPLNSSRNVLLGWPQRLQLWALAAASDHIFVATEGWWKYLRPRPDPSHFTHLPVSSNLPDRRERREAARFGYGLADGEVVVATLSGGHHSLLDDWVSAALLQQSDRRIVVAYLGAQRQPVAASAMPFRVIAPGFQTPDDLAGLVSAADVLLAPFIDGVSTRRTSVMAALQHGVPVLTNRGHLTDRMWSDCPGVVLSGNSRSAFAGELARMLDQPELLRELRDSARRTYEARFDWPHVVKLLVAL